MSGSSKWRRACAVVIALSWAANASWAPAHAQTIGNAAAGAALFGASGQNCASCHDNPPTKSDGNKVYNGVDWTKIRAAVSGGVGQMSKFSGLTDTQLQNLSAYICQSIGSTASTCNSAAPKISLTPTSLAFGSVQVATTSAGKSITVKNSGAAALTLGAITLTDTADFGLSHSCPASLATNASCTIIVTFKPQSASAYSASVQISHNDTSSTNPAAIALTGTGTAAPAPLFALSANTLTFSQQLVGQSSAAQTLTVSNIGNANLVLSTPAAALSGPNSADFVIASSTCSGATLTPGGTSCQVQVQYAPLTSGASKSATLTIADGSGIAPAVVAVQGSAATNPAPLLQANPPSIDFGPQNAGGAIVTRTLTLQNSGTATATGVVVGVSGGGAFGQTNSCSSSLAVGASCTVTVSFAPPTANTFMGSVAVTSSAPTVAVPLAGSGVAPTATSPTIALSPGTLTFSAQSQNTASAAQNIVLQNTGNADLPVTAVSFGGLNAADYALVPGTTCGAGANPGAFTLTVNQSCTLAVAFTPQATGASIAQLTVASGVPASGNPVVSLAGTGVAAPQPIAGLSTSLLSFPSTAAGAISTARGITLTNTGSAALTGSLVLTGPGANQFAIVAGPNACGSTLSVPGAGGSCTIYVQFAPSVVGTANATLSVSTNAGAYSVALAASAGAAAAAVPNFTGTGVWPSVLVGSSGGTQTFVLSNDGTAPMSVGAPTITGAAAADFGIAQSDCGSTLGALQTCSVVVVFTPNDVGSRQATLQVSVPGFSNLTAALSGVGSVLAVQSSPTQVQGQAPGAATQVGTGGGCTVGDPVRGLGDPLLPALGLLAVLALVVRRTQSDSQRTKIDYQP